MGTLTGLILKYVNKGEVVAVDISPASVNIARKRLKGYANVMLMVSDMSDFVHPGIFDFIVLPDVLEHIPSEQHRNLFRTLAEHMHENTVILIHIPHPRGIDFIRRTNPEQLQIVDQAIEADSLLADIYANGLMLLSYISYPLFDRENDYAVITIKKKGDITFSPLPKKTIIARKFLARIRFFLGRL
ncbi:class I SAM-dependent methyltransferase [bacterium]|nr:class I SAM-dependent methyltransferase [bacterium]